MPPGEPAAPVLFTWAGALRGARVAVPLLIGMTPFAIVVGIAAQAQGLSLLECGLMSGMVYAGSAQLVALAAWGHPASLLGASLAAVIVNLRLALMGPVLAPWLDRLGGWRLWGSLFLMSDQNWALSVTDMNNGRRDVGFLFGSGAVMWLMWLCFTMAGHVLGALVQPQPGHPLFFAALAVFVCMLVTIWRGRGDVFPWAVAAVIALTLARLLPGTSWYIVGGALGGSLAGGLRDHLRRPTDA
jgi:predicted branched-subunit amino acid permease